MCEYLERENVYMYVLYKDGESADEIANVQFALLLFARVVFYKSANAQILRIGVLFFNN